jgi:hypothetical protein
MRRCAESKRESTKLALSQQTHQVLPRQERKVTRPFQERLYIRHNAVPFHSRYSLCDKVPPIGDLPIVQSHSGLSQGCLK